MVTPPSTIHDPESTCILERATRVLSIEATALSHVTRLYQTDPHAREGLLGAVECITRSQAAGGKIIVCGVGKSGLVGRKTVATLKSLSIAASFMHAAEAAHGDLGDIREVCRSH
jgi:D-arabinose 5-phosphate isomerase GutQ